VPGNIPGNIMAFGSEVGITWFFLRSSRCPGTWHLPSMPGMRDTRSKTSAAPFGWP